MTDQVLKGQKALYDGDYQLLGQMIGEIFQMAEPASEEDPKVDFSNLAEMVQGFLSNFGEFNFMELLLCIYEADQSALMLYEDIQMAEEAWKDKDIMEGVFVAVLTLAFVQSLQQQVAPVCSTVFGNKDFSSLKLSASYGEVNMQGHIAMAREHLKAENWFNYGSELAATLSGNADFNAIY